MNKNINHYECPNCGANPIFNPSSQSLVCPYCNTVVEITTTTGVAEIGIESLLTNTKVWSNTDVIKCNNCSAEEIVPKNSMATTCSFCGTTNIARTSEIIGMKPHGICTFQKTPTEVCQNIKNWINKQKFLPNDFKNMPIMDNIKGIYSPAFTFDTASETNYNGRLGETVTKTKKDSDGHTSSYSYTNYFTISGKHNKTFDDLIIHSSNNIPIEHLQAIEPFPTNTCTRFSEKLLTGYTANTYTKVGQETWEDFKKRSDKIIRDEILNKYTYDKVDYLNTDTSFNNTKFKYLLLPVYVGHQTYKNKNYNFYVNGCTGKVSGKAPKSGLKILSFILGIIGVIALPILLTILLN